ncbi:hypothetical protein [Prauserella flavalba]|uniref:hypothetical protein n=1 Tax=Prauserella flavalba TaxID=1477506 RepID=UPI0036F01323
MAQATTMFTDTMNSKKNDLNSAATDGTHFSGEQWPSTTGADRETLADASVRDGDGSEWALV